jgi:hypothetical protein
MSALGHSRTFAPLSVAEPRPRTPSGQIRSPRAVPSPWRGLTLCPREQSEPFASYLKPVAATGPPDAASVAVGGTPWPARDRHEVSRGAFQHDFSSRTGGRTTDLPDVRRRDAACLDCGKQTG